ncbi:hypothetical protein [Aliiroseovarius sp. F47248L]|uniref:hypothetical protein n=1 Tax=Aliiroseovarius sp. F47248L TaxID=2926420 RepID=UPI001FF1E3E4|nr:hypothetical protein [Aliiroseovarius sp. F47248L]MCK0138207.1 hypothetical protein [Aliiroseovarius sp. F47248L]
MNMYARVTPYKMKPGSKAAATKIMESLKDKIMALPGQKSFLNVMNDDEGSGYVISTTELAEMSPETGEKVKALWSAFSEFLENDPKAKSYTVIANWKA